MRAIYEPTGAAREYAPLAVNLFNGCAHACRYCYAPAVLRKTPADFAADPQRRPGILDALARDAERLVGDPRRVLLCFTCDPFQSREAADLTAQAMRILGEHDLKIRLLTKAPFTAFDHRGVLEALAMYDVDFGVTCVFASREPQREWEPGTSAEITPEKRVGALMLAKTFGGMIGALAPGVRSVTTWLSVEPVIDPAETLMLLENVGRHRGWVDKVHVGRWNHDARANAIDWAAFLNAALAILTKHGQPYRIKDALWRHASPEARLLGQESRFP